MVYYIEFSGSILVDAETKEQALEIANGYRAAVVGMYARIAKPTDLISRDVVSE